MRRPALASLLLAALLAPLRLAAQDASPPAPAPTPAPTPAAAAEPSTPGGPQGARRVPAHRGQRDHQPALGRGPERRSTLTLLVTHRFIGSLQEGDINNFFTLDTGNTWGFGLWYAPDQEPERRLLPDVGSQHLRSVGGSTSCPTFCGFTSSLRVGEDWRTQDGLAATPKSSFFAQAILAYSFGQYVRLTAVPTYLQRTNGIDANLSRTHSGRPVVRRHGRHSDTSLSVLGTLR